MANHGSGKPSDKRVGICKVVRWFNYNSTIGGLGAAVRADNKVSRTFWAVLFLVGVAFTLVSVFSVIVEEYMAHKSRTTVSYSFPPRLRLPSLTICSNNRIHCGNLYSEIESVEKVEP